MSSLYGLFPTGEDALLYTERYYTDCHPRHNQTLSDLDPTLNPFARKHLPYEYALSISRGGRLTGGLLRALEMAY